MGRTYAGILGPLAMVVIICRGLKDSAGLEGTLTLAIVALAIYAIVGSIVGQIAQATIDESVRLKIERQLEARNADGRANGATT